MSLLFDEGGRMSVSEECKSFGKHQSLPPNIIDALGAAASKPAAKPVAKQAKGSKDSRNPT